MIYRIKKRVQSRRGFSLAEVLIAVLIVLMMTSIVAAGIPAASNAYKKAVDSANAQTLLSTAMTSLRTELSTAIIIDPAEIEPEGGDPVVIDPETSSPAIYYIAGDGSVSKITSENDGIYIDNGYFERLLVKPAASNKNLYVSFDNIEYNPDTGYITVSNLCVYYLGSSSDPLVGVPTFEIRVIT